MIDNWLILSLLKPFVDIIFQTYLESLRYELIERTVDQSEKKMAWLESSEKFKTTRKKIKYLRFFLQTIYPIFHLILIILFWIVGLTVED